MQKELKLFELLEVLNNIDDVHFDRITIVEENYQILIEPTGIMGNSINDRYECKKYDGHTYEYTSLNNIMTCVQEIGIESAFLERC